MKLDQLTKPLSDTEHSLFLSAINALRCAHQFKLADNLEERFEAIAKTPKIAIFVEGGMVQGVRSNIGQDLEVEVVDFDSFYNEEMNKADARWEELQTELEFGNL